MTWPLHARSKVAIAGGAELMSFTPCKVMLRFNWDKDRGMEATSDFFVHLHKISTYSVVVVKG